MRIEFDWDPAKATLNVSKHGIHFEEAMTVFGDRLSMSIFDTDHSETEDRWVTIGQSARGRLVVVVHTHVDLQDGHSRVRIISARLPTRKEGIQYREGSMP